MMYSLASFSISDMTECASELRKLGVGASSAQDVAQRIVSYLYQQLGNDQTGRQDCVLVRCFLTRAYGELDSQSQDCARRALACGPGSLDMKCLTLFGTAGERPEWNDRNRSRRYRSIPLADEQVVSQFPMVSQLLHQLGLELQSNTQPESDVPLDWTEHTLNVFHVAEAKGSPFVPAQEEFVIPFGIESVLGFGGVFPSKEFFTVILFSRQKISRETAERFKPLAMSVKLVLLPFDGSGSRRSIIRVESQSGRWQARAEALEHLLVVHEQTNRYHALGHGQAQEELRKRAEEALRLAKFSVDRAADAVYWIDPQAKILDVNEAASLMLGYSKEELCAMTVHDLNPDFQTDMWPGFWAETQRRGTMVFETAHRAKSGRMIPIEVSVNYLSYEGKEYHCAFVRDITERKRAEEELRRSQALITSMVENLPNMIFVKDAKDLKFVRFNKAGEHLLGHSREVLIGKSDYDFFPKEEADFFTVIDRQVLKTGSLLDIPEEPIETKHQGRRILHTKKIPIYDDTGEPQYLLGISEDITDRRRAEEALRQSEKQYRSIFENAVEGIFQTTLDGKYVAVNPALARMYGYDSPEDMIATITNIASQLYVDPGRRDEFIRLMQEQEELTGFEALVYRKDGSFIWISESVRAVRDPVGVLVGYEGTVEHITERKLADQRLRDTLSQVRTLSGRVATVQEEERTRIARELHDELGVGLTCLKIDLSRLTTIVGDGVSADARANLDDKVRSMAEQIDRTIASVQRLVTELRPAVLDDLGLVAAIEWQCQDFQKRTGIPCTCVTSAGDIAMDPEQATALFRICQETLTNTARHAQATAVTIKLELRSDSLQLVVADNGVGISDAKVSDRRSLGLLGMKERVALFGGEITIQGHPEKGTTVTVCLPRRLS
ncbi:MAG TPA: PAS domain S-box protein [Nitrospiraceae bacterium]|nr:PAS domain S-box protein [Nitrospiraceae bacterium]